MPYCRAHLTSRRGGGRARFLTQIPTWKEVIATMTRPLASIAPLFHRDEDGQGLAEYALILGLVAMIAIVGLIFMGGQISTLLSAVGTSV